MLEEEVESEAKLGGAPKHKEAARTGNNRAAGNHTESHSSSYARRPLVYFIFSNT